MRSTRVMCQSAQVKYQVLLESFYTWANKGRKVKE